MCDLDRSRIVDSEPGRLGATHKGMTDDMNPLSSGAIERGQSFQVTPNGKCTARQMTKTYRDDRCAFPEHKAGPRCRRKRNGEYEETGKDEDRAEYPHAAWPVPGDYGLR